MAALMVPSIGARAGDMATHVGCQTQGVAQADCWEAAEETGGRETGIDVNWSWERKGDCNLGWIKARALAQK